jgi:uncharacterized protein (UPF0335 family)
LNNEIELFIKAIKDFNSYDYDIPKIIAEYNRIEDLRKEGRFLEGHISLWTDTKASIDSQIAQSQLAINIFNELKGMGFGLKELKTLYNMVIEISKSNGIEYSEAISKFIKDIENNYDSKLGLEKSVNELNAKKNEIEEELPNYKFDLQLHGYAATLLNYLHSHKVTNIDIVNIFRFISTLINNDFPIYFPGGVGLWNPPSDNQKMTPQDYWEMIINQLKSLASLSAKAKLLEVQLVELKEEIKDLEEKKQGLNQQYAKSTSTLKYLFWQLQYYAKSMVNQKEFLERREKITYKPIIFLLVNNSNNREENDGNDEKEKRS